MKKSSKPAEEEQDNRAGPSTARVRPKVTSKKTFFDIHRIRRSSMNVGGSGTDGSIHPKAEWSAGKTDVGNGFQSGTNVGKTIFDPRTPILSSNQPAVSSRNTNKRPSPTVANPWRAAIDVQPTQPEEIMHLINPSRIVEKAETSRETLGATSRKSVMDKFRKNATRVIAAKRLEAQTRRKEKVENVEGTNPEEEFKFLNEKYVREGILPENFQSDFPTEKWSNSRIRNRRPDVRYGNENTTQVAAQGKRVAIQSEAKEPETIKTPLPARRSCDPHDVKDLRKLRDSDPLAGPSRDMTSRPQTDTSPVVDELFSTSNFFISNRENGGLTKHAATDSAEELKKMTKNGDRFEIENPFSDFSLQTLRRNKIPLKLDPSEIKSIPHYPDPSQPSTSKQLSPIDAFRPKVSLNEIVENPESEPRKSSFLQSKEFGTREKSVLDKAVTIVSSETSIGTLRNGRMHFEDVPKTSTELDQIDNMWTLSPLIRRILRQNFVWSCVLSKFHEFHKRPIQFEHFSKAFQATLIVRKPFDRVSIITDNLMGFCLMNHLANSFPAIIFNAADTLPICGRNIGMDYLQSLGNEELSRVGKSLSSSTKSRRETHPFLSSDPIPNSFRHGNLVEKITRYVGHVILHESLNNQYLYSHSNPMSEFASSAIDIKGDENFYIWASHCETNNHRCVLVERENTLFVNFFERILDFHQPYRSR